MIFIERRNDRLRSICAAYTERQYPTQEAVSPNDPPLQAYMNRTPLSAKLAALGLTVDDIASAARRAGQYVDRAPDGTIAAVHEQPQRDGHELAPPDLPELLRFLEGKPAPAPPDGFKFHWVGGSSKWRITRLSDNATIAEGLASTAACAAEMARRAV